MDLGRRRSKTILLSIQIFTRLGSTFWRSFEESVAQLNWMHVGLKMSVHKEH